MTTTTGRTARRRILPIALALAALAAAAPAGAALTPAGTTTLVAGPAASSLQDAPSGSPTAISADGRYVAFASRATFATGASPIALNLFLRDTQTDVTTLVSRSDGLGGAAADGGVDFGFDSRAGIAIVPGAQALDGPHTV